MAKQDYQGPYLGFWFNGHHSSEFNIVRVSTSNRYSEDMSPDIKDIVVERPGGDGSYYFGSTYQSKNFTVNFAFDSMTEEEYQQYNIWVNNKKPAKFSFDEWNETWNKVTKYYMAKISSNATLKFVCFDEQGQRVYKGEGSLTFNCQFPFIIEEKISEDGSIKIESELSSPVRISISHTTPSSLPKQFEIYGGNINLNFKIPDANISFPKSEEVGIIIDTRLGIIQGFKSDGKLTQNLYNQYISAGGFFEVTDGTVLSINFPEGTATEDLTITIVYYNYSK